MNRRTFVTALATLLSWPLTRLRAHENAVKALPKPAIRVEPAQVWLFDGETLVGARPPYYVAGRFIEIATRVDHAIPEQWMPRLPTAGKQAWAITRFQERERNTHLADHVSAPVAYDYVSGPKWWAPGIPKRNIYARIQISREQIEASRRANPGAMWRALR